MCIADDTKWLFFRIVPPPSAGEQYTTKLGYKQKTPWAQAHGVDFLYFVSVFKRFVQRDLISIFQLTPDRQTKGEPCYLNAQWFEQF